MSGTIGELLAAACQRYRGRLALVRGDETRSYVSCSTTGRGWPTRCGRRGWRWGRRRRPCSRTGSPRWRSTSGLPSVTSARSAVQVTPRAADGDLAIVGYTSGTTGLPQGAMISQRALTDCVRLMPSMFRISSYGRCAFTGTLSFVSGIWGVILPHLYTGGTVTFLHPYTPESWVDHIEADQSTFTYAPNRSSRPLRGVAA